MKTVKSEEYFFSRIFAFIPDMKEFIFFGLFNFVITVYFLVKFFIFFDFFILITSSKIFSLINFRIKFSQMMKLLS